MTVAFSESDSLEYRGSSDFAQMVEWARDHRHLSLTEWPLTEGH
jgi:hypothetical protein